jgi:hypothetical protein
MRYPAISLFTVALTLGISGAAFAADECPEDAGAPAAAAASAPHAAVRPLASAFFVPSATIPGAFSAMIERDPENGTWRVRSLDASPLLLPDPESFERSFVGLVEEPLPSGGFMVDLHERFMDYVVVTLGDDGRLRFGCADSHESASNRLRFVRSLPPVALPEE